MKMTLSLSFTDGTQIFTYEPSEKHWWITGFNSNYQNVQAYDLEATVTIDFSDRLNLWNGFITSEKADEWTFDYDKKIASIKW